VGRARRTAEGAHASSLNGPDKLFFGTAGGSFQKPPERLFVKNSRPGVRRAVPAAPLRALPLRALRVK